jgi:hypothetical protein
LAQRRSSARAAAVSSRASYTPTTAQSLRDSAADPVTALNSICESPVLVDCPSHRRAIAAIEWYPPLD